MLKKLLRLAAPALLLSGCAHRLIPGSEVEDTGENRSIMTVIEAYRQATEARDADKIATLISPSFFEDNGTPDASDDYDYAGLKRKLGEELQKKVKSSRLDITVKKILVEGDRAKVHYFYTFRYETEPSKSTGDGGWQQESDLNELKLKKEAGAWKITGGV